MDTSERVFNIQLLNKEGVRKTNLRFFVYLFYASILIGCVKSPGPSASELLPVTAPFFGGTGAMDVRIGSPTINYNLVGTCDSSNEYQTEYSLNNQATWTVVPCINNSFTIPLNLSQTKTVYARSRGKFLYSAVCRAVVRLLLPPTSDTVMQVASAKADATDGWAQGSQNFLSMNWGHETVSGVLGISMPSRPIPTLVRLGGGLPRLVYEP
jgi:hypothetical protein